MNAEVSVEIGLGRVADREGRPAAARAHYEQALRALRDDADASHAASLLRWVGATYRAEGDHEAAIDCVRASLAVARLHRSTADVAHALNWMGILGQDRGHLDRSDRLFAAARRLARRIGDRRTVAMVDQNLGINCNIRGELTGALFHYRRSLASYEAMGEDPLMARVLNVMGMLNTDLGRWRAADAAFDRAALLSVQHGELQTQVMVEVNRVELCLARGMLAEATSTCERARRLAESLAQPALLGEVLRWQGAVQREAGHAAAAEANLLEAERIARKHDAPLLEAEATRELGLVYRQLGRNREALRALLRARRVFSGIRAQRDLAEVARKLGELEDEFLGVVREWAESIEAKDAYTHGHCYRVALYATTLARHLRFDEATLKWFEMGAYLHDVGKLEVPLDVLNKPGKLDPREWEIMKRHTVAGDAIVAELDFPWNIRPLVRHHHEHWDGNGYPDGLAGENIPLGARVLCVADVYDALTSDRPYRAAHAADKALAIMQDMAGTVLDPALFGEFLVLARAGAFVELVAA